MLALFFSASSIKLDLPKQQSQQSTVITAIIILISNIRTNDCIQSWRLFNNLCYSSPISVNDFHFHLKVNDDDDINHVRITWNRTFAIELLTFTSIILYENPVISSSQRVISFNLDGNVLNCYHNWKLTVKLKKKKIILISRLMCFRLYFLISKLINSQLF